MYVLNCQCVTSLDNVCPSVGEWPSYIAIRFGTLARHLMRDGVALHHVIEVPFPVHCPVYIEIEALDK